MGLRTGGRRAKGLKNRVKSSKIELRFREIRSQSSSSRTTVQQTLISVHKEIIFGTRIYVQILVLQGFVELSDVVKSGGIYSVRNAFATRLQQKYLKNIGHFSVLDTGECPFYYADFVSEVMLSSFSKVLLIASTRTCISK